MSLAVYDAGPDISSSCKGENFRVNAFSVSNVPHLYLTQFIAYEVKQKGEKTLLLLWTNMDHTGPIQACRAMLLEDLWDIVIEVPLTVTKGYHIRNAFPMPGNLNPIRAARAAIPAQQYLHDLFHQYRDRLASITIHNCRNPLDRYLGLEANRSGISLRYLEDGFNAYLNQAFRLQRHKGISYSLVRALRYAFMKITRLDRDALAYTNGIFDPIFNFDLYFLVFPEAIQSLAASKKFDLRELMTPQRIAEFHENYPIPDEVKKTHTPVVFLGRADSEDGLMEQEIEVSITTELLKILKDKIGDEIFYKPHPRDRAEKVTAILERSPGIRLMELRTTLPIEILAPTLGMKMCLCLWSVPQIYLKAFYSIPTFGFMPWAIERLREANALNPRYEEICAELQCLFPTQTHWIRDPGELADHL